MASCSFSGGKVTNVLTFSSDSDFTDFRSSEMKQVQSKGLGSTKWQAEVLTEHDEEKLWKEGLLHEYHA